MAFDDPIVWILIIALVSIPICLVYQLLKFLSMPKRGLENDEVSLKMNNGNPAETKKRNSFVQGLFSGLNGLGKAVIIVVFAGVLMFLTANIFTGIAIAAIALYAWMLQGEVEALENRIRKLEQKLSQDIPS